MDADTLVIGAGFGGLSAALHLADAGQRVVLCEALNYPGGCASTFRRDGLQFEAGATLFFGFGEGQLMHRWVQRFGLDVQADRLAPVLTLRAPGLELVVDPERDAFVERLAALPGAPQAAIRRFFHAQARLAAGLHPVLEQPDLLPPWGPAALLSHAVHLPRYLPLAGALGRPAAALLARTGADFEPLRLWLDAACQITVQAAASEAEAPFALSAVDMFFKGAYHVRGGIGALATALVRAIRARGGDVQLATRVRRLERRAGGWAVHTRRGVVTAERVVANVLPQDLAGLADVRSPRLDALGRRVRGGWGAAMLYLVVADEGLPRHAFHLQLVGESRRPLIEGNLVLCSVSDAREERSPPGTRTVTVSTHVPLPTDAAAVEAVQARMRRTVAERAPELRVVRELTASPRTFQRFTRRHGGYVGGVPRRTGLGQYLDLLHRPVAPGLYLVGDTVFPGQSTLATAVGGQRVARTLDARVVA